MLIVGNKEEIVFQQVTIKAETSLSLKPLLESAIQGELKTVQHGINRTRERLSSFEKQFNMTSGDFHKRFQARELEETLDFIDWWGEIKMLALLEERRRALEGMQIG
jgi:hypothetical protein